MDFAEAIKERIGRQRTALESIRAKRMTAPPEKLVVQLVPKSDDVSKLIESGGYNPRLQLTLKSTKSIAGVVNHISKKWVGTDGKCLSPFPIRLYPIEKRAGHCGWGAEDSETLLLGIFQTFGCPQAVRFEYSWPEVVIPMGFADSVFENEEDTLSDLALLQQQKNQGVEITIVSAPVPIQPVATLPINTVAPLAVPAAQQQPIFDPSAFSGFASPMPALMMSTTTLLAPAVIQQLSTPIATSETWEESYGYEPSSVEELSTTDCPADFYTPYLPTQTQGQVASQSYYDATFY